MNAATSDRALDVLAEALELAAAERTAFVAQTCAGDPALREVVHSLLAHEDNARDFLETPYVFGGEASAFEEQGELQPGDVLGDCTVVRLLGEGGMGEVYLARDNKLERDVALKLLKPDLSSVRVSRRFQHERKVLAGLTHPNIARLYGSGDTPQGRSYLVIEYVEGERLDRHCEMRGLGITERLTLFLKVCEAVACAHQSLVVHRDLKPANIRVTPEGEPKLLDFGIAKLLDPEGIASVDPAVTIQGAMTPEYASPEQINGEPITTSSDLYSLGVILYELLGGRRPHELKGRRPDELARAICEEEPPRPSAVTSGKWSRRLAGDVDNIVAKAMAKEPARRYGSAAAFAEDIRRQGAGLPVSARRDTLAYRAGKFVRRNKVAVAAAAVVLLALVGGLVSTTWEARLARRERDRARSSQARAETAQKQAERLNDFLQTLLGSADPSGMGKDVKVVQVLDAAGKSLDRELAAEPELLIQAHETLSRAYGRLEVLGPAEQHARAALELARRLHGADSVAAAQAEIALGTVLNGSFRVAEAESLLRHAVVVERRDSPGDPHAIAEGLQTLGATLDLAHRTQEAAPLLAEALELMRQTRGERSADFVRVLYEIAHAKHMETEAAALQGVTPDLDGAVAAYRRVAALCDEVLPHSAEALTAKFYLCTCLLRQHQLRESEETTKALAAEIRQELGEDNSFYAKVCVFGAMFDFERGDNARVVEELRQPLELMVRTYLPEHRNVVQVRGMYGLALTRLGRAAEGEPYLRAAYDDGRKTERFPFQSTFGNVETALGECLSAQARYAEAEPLLLTGFEDLQKRLGPGNRLTLQAGQQLHGLYLAWNKPAEAARFEPNAIAETTLAPEPAERSRR